MDWTINRGGHLGPASTAGGRSVAVRAVRPRHASAGALPVEICDGRLGQRALAARRIHRATRFRPPTRPADGSGPWLHVPRRTTRRQNGQGRDAPARLLRLELPRYGDRGDRGRQPDDGAGCGGVRGSGAARHRVQFAQPGELGPGYKSGPLNYALQAAGPRTERGRDSFRAWWNSGLSSSNPGSAAAAAPAVRRRPGSASSVPAGLPATGRPAATTGRCTTLQVLLSPCPKPSPQPSTTGRSSPADGPQRRGRNGGNEAGRAGTSGASPKDRRGIGCGCCGPGWARAGTSIRTWGARQSWTRP